MMGDMDGPRLEGTPWHLATGVAVPTGVTVTARFAEGTVAGQGPVNRYRADYRLDESSLRLGPAAATLMAGPEAAMAAEHAYFALLGAVTGFRLGDDGRSLTLLDAAGDGILGFIAGPDMAEGLVGRWEVRFVLRGDALVSPPVDSSPWLAFVGSGGVEGHGGVNRLHGTARVDGDRLYLGPLASTRMAGPPDAMDAEEALLSALEAVATYRLDGAHLELVDADGQVKVQLAEAPGA